MDKEKVSLTLKNQRGLHTRAAAKLVDTAKRFQCKIEAQFNHRTVDAKSIMGVITLGAQFQQTMEFNFEGHDASLAKEAITKLIEDCFGENE